MRYLSSVPFRGDIDRALGLAASTLTGVGFRLTGRTAESVRLAGPGVKSTRRNGLRGASHIFIWANGGELVIEAELGGVARMSRFLIWFPICLVLGLGIAISLV